ncbi:MAG: hypothetical protein JST59_10575 [Actinobacteria bacterium]|nr:hypothetical protein [Actinomycetota bacterium]
MQLGLCLPQSGPTAEGARRGADGVHVDFTFTAGSAAELLEGAGELVGPLGR